MPFAVLAVTILLLSVVAGAITASYDRTDDNAGGTEDGIHSIDVAVEDVTGYVNRGLGEIIRDISMDDSLGDIEDRIDEFDRRTNDWIEYQFPMNSDGAHVECNGHGIALTSVPMGITIDDGSQGYIPTYLKGKGTLTVTIESQSGKTETELEISTDGSYALPLAAERGSLFESMSAEGGISLSQMMMYQLSAIAQYRILDGYGVTAENGRSAYDVITASDVEDAFDICIEAIETICFREDGKRFSEKDMVDLADILALNDDLLTLNMAAIYSQALISAVDDIFLKWMDYLYGFEIANALISTFQPYRESMGALQDYLEGIERVSGVPYLKNVMELNGYDESEYRFPGDGTTTVSVSGITVTVDNPTADLFSQQWLCNFKYYYDKNNNFVEDYIMDVLRGAATKIASSDVLEPVTLEVNPYDSRSFMDTIMDVVSSSIDQCVRIVEEEISFSLDTIPLHDEFYGRLADEVLEHSDDLVLDQELRSSLKSAIGAVIEKKRAEAEEKGEEYKGPTVEQLMSSAEVSKAVDLYRSSVLDDLSRIESLRNVVDEDDNLVKRLLTELCHHGLHTLGITLPMEERITNMVSEILDMNGTNPYGDVVSLPGSTGFLLEDEDGNILGENLDVTVSTDSDHDVTRVSILYDRCIHNTGFMDGSCAAYSTVYHVELIRNVSYDIIGTGSLAHAMGTHSSAYGKTFTIDVGLDIAVASGWALSGIDYIPTDTLIGDLWKILLKELDGIIEPLREILETIRSAFTALAESIMETVGFVSDYVVRLYEVLMEPMMELKAMLSDFLQETIEKASFDILAKIGLNDQNLILEFFGCTLTFTTNAISWASNTKSILAVELSMPIAGCILTAGVDTKLRGDPADKNLLITFNGSVTGDDWKVKMKLDPLMKSSKYLVTLDGKVGRNKVSIVAPDLEDYCEAGIALSDTEVGDSLDNIPLPALGVNVGFDVGFSLRYTDPKVYGLIVNEYESNPEGEDGRNEWIELLNNSIHSLDLDGYTLVMNRNGRDSLTPLNGTLSPGEYLIIHPEYTMVNTDGGTLKILDPNGNVLDRVEMEDDTKNDSRTHQRQNDGSIHWDLTDGSPGSKNNGPSMLGIDFDDLKSCVWKGVEKAFGKIGYITDMETLELFIQYLVRYTLEELINDIAGTIVDASIFVSVDVKDVADVTSTGFRFALRTDGELVKDCLKYISGKVQSLMFGIKNPYRIDPLGMFTENIDLEVLFHTGIGFPDIIADEIDELPELDLGIVFRTNIAALTRLAGTDTGSPGFEFGVLARDIPEYILPSRLSPKEGMDHDLWLFRTVITLS